MKTMTFYNNAGVAFVLIERLDGGVLYVDGNYQLFYTDELAGCGLPLVLLDLLCDQKPKHIIDFLIGQMELLKRMFPKVVLKEF
jgi:hypothetical protein